MKRIVWVLLLLALAGCRRKQTIAPEEASAGPTVVRARGAVWRALPDGQRQPLAGGAVREGDILATGDDGAAVVLLGPGREIELRPNARVRLRREQGQLVAELENGQVVSRATAAASNLVLTVLTPFGITRVPGGHSEATIDVDKEGVHIAVSFGEIAFVDPSGKTVTAAANETIEVKLGTVEVVRPGAPPPAERLEVVLSSEIGPLLIKAPAGR